MAMLETRELFTAKLDAPQRYAEEGCIGSAMLQVVFATVVLPFDRCTE